MAEENQKDSEYSETFETFQNPMQDYFEKHLVNMSKSCVVQPHGLVMAPRYPTYHSQHLSYPCKESDIWVATFAKCGTTWTQELVWCLIKGMDDPNGKKPLMERFPFFEWDSLISDEFLENMTKKLPPGHHELPGGQWQVLEAQKEPRLVKTHLFFQVLPKDVVRKGCKIVYVVRDPRDVCVSLYYHTRKFIGYTGDFDHFVKLFINDTYEFGPFWANVLGYWNQRKSGNILFLTYEDMKKDLAAEIRKVAQFLNKSPTEDYIEKMVKHLSFDSMKNNSAVNNESIMSDTSADNNIKFMRKGIVGDHKNHLTEEHLKMFEEWTERWLQGSDFPYYRNHQN